jgi:Domain found in Dishevelled, Egl-10, and Pleckstrin (DEP)
MNAVNGTVILAQSDHYQETLLTSAFLSMNLAVRKVKKELPLIHEIKAIRSATRGQVIVCADLARIAQERMLWPQFTAAVRSIVGDVEFVANQSSLLRPSHTARAWAMKHGAVDLFGRVSHLRVGGSMRPVMDVVSQIFRTEHDSARVDDYIRGMHGALNDDADECAVLQNAWKRLEAAGQPPAMIAEEMIDSGRVEVRDRRYRLKLYPNCFLGSEAVDWISRHLSVGRAQAENVGNLLMKLGYFYHVAKDQPLKDGEFYYRYSAPEGALGLLDIDLVMAESRELRGFDSQDRRWRGMSFPRCFVGSEAVDWLSSFYGIERNEAICLGQVLYDLYHFRHVADEHDFVDHDYFYRMTMDR